MTELKTLKDFPLLSDDIRMLKAEAVKWANAMYDDEVDEHGIDSFMNFFNLTEEDLK